jgi:hypothetical protein
LNRGATPLSTAEHYASDCNMRVRQQRGLAADLEREGYVEAAEAGRRILSQTCEGAENARLFLQAAQKVAPINRSVIIGRMRT